MICWIWLAICYREYLTTKFLLSKSRCLIPRLPLLGISPALFSNG
ncbi:Uncharacterised protein [Vibrio cholerae]|nr:Uncharacterised protein [Vibrio cholerae]